VEAINRGRHNPPNMRSAQAKKKFVVPAPHGSIFPLVVFGKRTGCWGQLIRREQRPGDGGTRLFADWPRRYKISFPSHQAPRAIAPQPDGKNGRGNKRLVTGGTGLPGCISEKIRGPESMGPKTCEHDQVAGGIWRKRLGQIRSEARGASNDPPAQQQKANRLE